MMTPAAEFFKKYQASAGAEGVDPLGYYLGGWGYAYINMLGEADHRHQEHRRRQDRRLSAQDHTSRPSWATGATARSGEWTKSGMMQVQYHDIKEGAGLETWKGMSYQTVLTPADLKTGNVIYPYEKALQ